VKPTAKKAKATTSKAKTPKAARPETTPEVAVNEETIAGATESPEESVSSSARA